MSPYNPAEGRKEKDVTSYKSICIWKLKVLFIICIIEPPIYMSSFLSLHVLIAQDSSFKISLLDTC